MSGDLFSDGSGVVLWSRVRLCRNLANKPFVCPDKVQKRASSSSDDLRAIGVRQGVYEEISESVKAVRPKKTLHLKKITDVPNWKIIDFFERGVFSDYLKQHRRDKYRGIITGPKGSVAALVNEQHHLVLQSVCSGFQLERAWNEADKLDDLFSSELEFAWSRKFGYLLPNSECCGTGLDVMVNVHIPGLILLDEISQAVSAFGAMGLRMNTEISDDVLVGGFGQLLRITNNMTVSDSEDTVLSKIEQAVSDLVVQEEQARKRILKDSSLKRLLYNKIACALAVLQNSLLVSRSDAFELLSWLKTGAAMGLVRGITPAGIDRLHQDVWASNFLSYFDGSFDEAVEHVSINRAVVLTDRLRNVKTTFDF
ncbi:MAG: hypothetical protein R6V06_00220 [Kiritimatiellia bacterium]